MTHSRAEQQNTYHIDQAVRAGKPATVVGVTLGGEHILAMPFARDVPLPEPVATDWLNGRPPGGWVTAFGFALFPPPDAEHERAAICSARERERRAELAQLALTVPP